MKLRLGIAAVMTTGFLVAQGCMAPESGGEDIGSVDQAYGSCSGLRTWDGGNYLFTVAQGETIQWNGHAYQANVDITYPNAECAPDNHVDWCANWFTDLGACGSTSTSTSTSNTAPASSIPDACYTNNRIDMTCAQLAVAMAQEIGELNPVRDLTVSNDRVVLSNEGLSRCSNGCVNTKAILDLQDYSVNDVIDESVFSANNFRANLLSQLGDQQQLENSLSLNSPDQLPAPYTLTLVQTQSAYCGTQYSFQVNWQCSGGTSSGGSTTSVSTSATYTIKGVQSGVCLDIQDGSMSDGGNARIWSCNGMTAQQFKFEDMGSGYYRIRNVNSGKCLDVWAKSTADGANIAQYTCGTGYNQQFSVNVTNGQVYLKSRNSGKAVDIGGSSSGANAQQYSYWGGDNQKFTLNEVGGSSSSTSSDCTTDTSTIENRMRFFRPTNTVIDFMAGSSSISIDPTGSLIDGGDSGSGSCTDACMKFTRNASSLLGTCCTCNGLMGTFKQGQNSYTLLCNTN